MAKKQDFETVVKTVRKLISEIAEVAPSKVKDDATFTEDMGIDSMKALEIVAAVEKKFKVVIPEDKIPTIKTPKDVYNILQKALK
jgi:acyl carrier protein